MFPPSPHPTLRSTAFGTVIDRLRGSRLSRATAWLALLVMALTASLGDFAMARHTRVVMVAGIPVVMCGPGEDGQAPDHPRSPPGPGCCEHCVLGAPMILSDAPAAAPPTAVAHVVVRDDPATRPPVVSRTRTPRQSQGPPAA